MDMQIKKGILDVCVLYSISKAESYGYKIINDLRDVIDITESTLYPILRRLEVGGFLTTRIAEYCGRLRRYYSITASGLAKLQTGKRELLEIFSIYKKLFGGDE